MEYWIDEAGYNWLRNNLKFVLIGSLGFIGLIILMFAIIAALIDNEVVE